MLWKIREMLNSHLFSIESTLVGNQYDRMGQSLTRELSMAH
ncbi:hypothetical protein AM1_C0143 (plasmid) [Acaryochloris marina MBIC11017]|uniref:Uncharacterized protein n=1 Tax=Acaryochloris marina (strain MBIC 11017) TaxID=329726 RepID=A8ZMN8_ACAM1|nr:hypothetical protein AM1_C0143 [Acaryochloris marina MBIC11017]